MRKIIHIDMDYFFVQVEELSNPRLKSLPVAIGSRKYKRGVLATSNYIARSYGVKSAMPTGMALKLCPDLVLIAPQFDKYRAASKKIQEIFREFSDHVQVVSIDEAYLDVTDCELFDNDAIKIAKAIKQRIWQETSLSASAGVSYNKLLAKIGSDLQKPNGLSVLRPDGIQEKIASFSVAKISGVGKVTQMKMKKYGIETFGDLQKQKKIKLIHLFGDYGITLYHYCRGLDEREVSANGERKSLSIEHTYPDDIKNKIFLLEKIDYLFEELKERMSKHSERLIKSYHVKIKYADFSQTTVETSYQLDELQQEQFYELLERRIPEKQSEQGIRLLGLGVKFYTTRDSHSQLELPLVI